MSGPVSNQPVDETEDFLSNQAPNPNLISEAEFGNNIQPGAEDENAGDNTGFFQVTFGDPKTQWYFDWYDRYGRLLPSTTRIYKNKDLNSFVGTIGVILNYSGWKKPNPWYDRDTLSPIIFTGNAENPGKPLGDFRKIKLYYYGYGFNGGNKKSKIRRNKKSKTRRNKKSKTRRNKKSKTRRNKKT